MSQSTLPAGVRTSRARWPIAVAGLAPMPVTPGPSSLIRPRWPAAWSSASVVHRCPSQPTYWRSSRQIGQSGRGLGVLNAAGNANRQTKFHVPTYSERCASAGGSQGSARGVTDAGGIRKIALG